MKLSDILQSAMDAKGLRTLAEKSKATGVSQEMIRLTLKGRHVPSDKTLTRLASGLGMDAGMVILAAHKQRVSKEATENFLAPSKTAYSGKKRLWPLSQEQCEYLQAIMSPHEIQLLRKYRQVTKEEQYQILGVVDFFFIQQRKSKEEAMAQISGSTAVSA